MEIKEKELKDYNKKNIHHKKHLSTAAQDKIIERLYNKDIQKRKEKHETLLKIYEFSFKPNIQIKKINYHKEKGDNNNLLNTKSTRHFNRNKKNSKINNNSNLKSITIKSKYNDNNNFMTDSNNYINTSYAKKKTNVENSTDEENSNSEDMDDEIIANRLRSRLFSNKK